MTVFIVDTFVVKPEKQREFMQLNQRFLKYKKENPERLREMKSWKLFVQTFGGISDAYFISMEEFDNMEDVGKHMTRVSKDEELMKILQELMLLVDPATFSRNVWNVVM